ADYRKALELDPTYQSAAEAIRRLTSIPRPSGEPSQVVTIEKPRVGNLRLDWCREWAQNCGKAAADAYCRRQGFVESASFARASRVGEPTHVIGTGQTCNNASCDGFANIACRKSTSASTNWQTHR